MFPWRSSLDRSRANAIRPITATRPITANARMVVLSSSAISSNDGGAGPRHGMPGVVSQSGRQGGCGGEGGEGTPNPVSARLRPSTNRSKLGSITARDSTPKKLAKTPVLQNAGSPGESTRPRDATHTWYLGINRAARLEHTVCEGRVGRCQATIFNFQFLDPL